MTSRILTCICSGLFCLQALAQEIRIEKLRVGFDPVRTATMLCKEKDSYNNRIYFNTWEAIAEIIGPERTSLLIEIGGTKTHLQELRATVDYHSRGTYLKGGLDFTLIGIDKKYEFDLGWRLGSSIYRERGSVRLEGRYWDNTLVKSHTEKSRQATWGELLINQKLNPFAAQRFLSHFWIGLSFRLKFRNTLFTNDGVGSLMIPGYGPNNSFSPGITFSLNYQFSFKPSIMHELHHKHANDWSYKHSKFYRVQTYHHIKGVKVKKP